MKADRRFVWSTEPVIDVMREGTMRGNALPLLAAVMLVALSACAAPERLVNDDRIQIDHRDTIRCVMLVPEGYTVDQVATLRLPESWGVVEATMAGWEKIWGRHVTTWKVTLARNTGWERAPVIASDGRGSREGPLDLDPSYAR